MNSSFVPIRIIFNNFINHKYKRHQFNILIVIMLVLLFYSLIPLSVAKTFFWHRISGVPLSYLPLLSIFLFSFLKELGASIIRHNFIKHSPLMILLLFLIYLPIQYILLKSSTIVNSYDYFLDFAMFSFYSIVVFYGTTLYFSNRSQKIGFFINIVDKLLFFLVIICLISPVRYFVFDINSKYFYNLFNPLRYRIFEVLFLVSFSAISSGYYYATGRKKYFYYLIIYGSNLLLSGSRTGYIAYLFLLTYFIIRENRHMITTFKGLVFLTTILAILFLGGDRVINRLERVSEVGMFATLDIDRSIEEHKDLRRIAFIKASLELASKYPVLGVGLGKKNLENVFPDEYRDYAHTVTRPHNFYLYMFVATGLIGFILIFLFMIYIVKYGFRVYRNNYISRPINEIVLSFIFVNILILIMQLGYEFETEPFLWQLWGITFWFFYAIKSKLSRLVHGTQ